MGQKDIGEKILEAYNDVFADIVNVLLFHGKPVLKEDELEEQAPRSAYKADGKYREIERDVAKRWKNENICLACVGVENQTLPDRDMPLRIIGYDGAEYRTQLNSGSSSSRYPVVTLVLYFDHRKRWNEPLTLLECLDVPEDFRPFVNDYRVNLFDIAFLTPEQVGLFRSDFRFIADYFVQMRTTGTYAGNRDKIRHVQETLSLMSIMTRDHRFESVLSDDSVPTGREIETMCDVLNRIEERGKEAGLAEGKSVGLAEGKSVGLAEGEMKANIAMARKLIARGKMTLDEIAEDTGLSRLKLEDLKKGMSI